MEIGWLLNFIVGGSLCMYSERSEIKWKSKFYIKKTQCRAAM